MPTRRLSPAVLLIWALMGCLAGAGRAASAESVDVRGPAGSLGILAVTVTDDSRGYVAPDRLAVLLKGTWTVKGDAGTLTVGKRTAEFGRGQARATVQGTAITLDSAPRISGRGWLISRDFLGKGLTRLAPGVSVIAVTEPRNPTAKTVQGSVPLEELRYRSYPSFTRVVIETGARLAYAVVATDEEVRVRLPGLSLSGSRIEEIADGLVQEVRLEPVGEEATLRVILEGTAGEVKHTVLQDPYRLVLDIYRPKDTTGAEPGRGGAMQPLKLIVLDAGHGGHDSGAIGPSG